MSLGVLTVCQTEPTLFLTEESTFGFPVSIVPTVRFLRHVTLQTVLSGTRTVLSGSVPTLNKGVEVLSLPTRIFGFTLETVL